MGYVRNGRSLTVHFSIRLAFTDYVPLLLGQNGARRDKVMTCVSYYEEWVNRQGVLSGLGGQRQPGRNMRALTSGRSLTSLS